MHGFWPDVLTKSKGKTAFNEAAACNIDYQTMELLPVHLVRRRCPVLASGYGGVAYKYLLTVIECMRIHRRIVTPET